MTSKRSIKTEKLVSLLKETARLMLLQKDFYHSCILMLKVMKERIHNAFSLQHKYHCIFSGPKNNMVPQIANISTYITVLYYSTYLSYSMINTDAKKC